MIREKRPILIPPVNMSMATDSTSPYSIAVVETEIGLRCNSDLRTSLDTPMAEQDV